MFQLSEVAKLRRKVLAEISRLTFAGRLATDITEILSTVVTEDGPRYRCCVHKERAVLKDRINLALSQPIGTPLDQAAQAALDGQTADLPVMNVLPEACDRCPIDKFLVTDACRNCLAHNCIASCPRKAIMVVQNRAYIDKAKCVECGLCKRSCSYGAIIEISRPCERACDLKAITAGSDRRAYIDQDKCVSCGACKQACPFGAIADWSAIVQVIRQLRQGRKVHALLAPTFVGQFGPKVKPAQIVAGLRRMGFADVVEASVGADIVALAEAREFVEAVPNHQPYMTTSCCPAFAAMVTKHSPAAADKVSTTVSPMVATAKLIKEEDAEAVVVFIGPCTGKKEEARRSGGLVDYVLTFEEVAAMLVGADINVAEIEAEPMVPASSRAGVNFARAGGVTQAVAAVLADIAPTAELKPLRVDGLADCKAALDKLQAGEGNFLEGMACPGGCVGGPGILIDQAIGGKLVEIYATGAAATAAPENPDAVARAGKDSWHRS